MCDKNNFYESIMIFSWIIFLFLCLFLLSFTSHAASEQDYFPMFQNNNGFFSDFDKTSIENYFDSENNYVFAYFAGYQSGYGTRMKNFYVLKIPKSSGITIYGEKYTNLQQFNLYAVGGSFSNSDFTFYQILDQGWTYSYGANLSSFVGMPSSNYNNQVDYVSNFQIMTNNTSSAQVVLFYDDGVTIPEGDTAREDMDKPDIDDYIPTWSNKPSFDGSSVENALSSIWDITVWTAENTADTIKGVGEFIGDTLRWTSQKIINSIRDKIDDLKSGIISSLGSIQAFVNDIKGFVSSIKSKIDYITEPVNTSSISTALSSSDVGQLVSIGNSYYTYFNNYFSSIPQRDSLIIRIPYTILTAHDDIVVDFSWYSNIRDDIVPWIVGFLYAGFGLALFRSVPSIVHGLSGISQKGA